MPSRSPSRDAGRPTLERIRATHRAVAPHVVRTPVRLWSDPPLTDLLAPGTEVWLKEELFQGTGTFKPGARWRSCWTFRDRPWPQGSRR